MTALKTLAQNIICDAVKAKTKCRLTVKSKAVTMISYRWATEKESILKFQTIKPKSVDATWVLEWFHVSTESAPIEQGALIIDWEKSTHVNVNEYCDRILLKIDDLEINFLEKIVVEKVTKNAIEENK